ncbi:tRNA (adenosine(37)-N6)-threonylcarbamoyltransferase complex dimerization subunit type 1 TsaB [soil metagenome]
MRTLVLDCATQALSLALFDDDDCTAHQYRLMSRGHAEALVPMIGEMLDGGRADAVAVDVGPGSFTGIRVGLAAARALGLAWGVPVAGYGCLPLCAAMARGDSTDPIAIVMTGGHGELFSQRFDPLSMAPLDALASTPVADLAGRLTDARVHGSGAVALIAARGWGEAVDCLPDARFWTLLPAAYRSLPPTAHYGREADAKPMVPAAVAVGEVGTVGGAAA